MAPEKTGAAIRANAISVGYHQRPVLRGVSLGASFGELLAIVGPNGAGKTTLLRTLSGALAPWQGSVELMGQPLASFDRRALARRIAFVAQDSAAAFSFTVMEVVLMGRAPHLGPLAFEGKRDLEIARQALERFDLLALASRQLLELSGGERKRVFLARALAQEPAVAILDEPTAFLDLKHVAEIFELLSALRQERAMTVIATLHDLNVAALYADRVLLLKDGAAVQCGPPEAVLTEENIRSVYETEVYVGRNPATGAPMVMPGARRDPIVLSPDRG